MKKHNPSKAQLRRDNARLQRAAARHSADAKAARAQMLRAEYLCQKALQLLTELQPDLAKLIVHPDGLPPDPGLQRILSMQPPSVERLISAYATPGAFANNSVEHWITRMRFWCEARRPEMGHRMLCWRLDRPPGKDRLCWQYAFDDRLLDRSRTAVCEMIHHMADRLCADLGTKLAR